MQPRLGIIRPLSVLAACALISCAAGRAKADLLFGIVSSDPTVEPVADPWAYNVPLQFNPNTSIGEYFAPNPPSPATPTDYFTITGFGTIINITSLSLTDFALDPGRSTPTVLEFDYTGTSNLSTALNIGSIAFDTDTLSNLLTIKYFDHKSGGAPNSGTNLIPVTLVPEPSAVALLALGSAGGLFFRHRMRSRLA